MVELSSEGCSLSDLARAAETFGLGVESYALPSTEYLAKLDAETPAIVQVRGNHFALIWGAGDSEIFYADYPKKLQKLHHSAVDSTWDPRILLIKRMDAPPVFNGVATRWLSRGLATALAITLLVLTVTSLKRPKGAHRDDSGGSVAS